MVCVVMAAVRNVPAEILRVQRHAAVGKCIQQRSGVSDGEGVSGVKTTGR